MHPILSWKSIEEISEGLLREYNSDILYTPQELDVYHFLENYLRLKVDYQNLSNDQSVLGMTTFSSGRCFVWDNARQNQYWIDVKEGTVLIDNFLLETLNEGRERFTVSHECGHQILHKNYFSEENNNLYRSIVCNRETIGQVKASSHWTSRDWVEWQANTFASALLMPAATVTELFCQKSCLTPNSKRFPLEPTFDTEAIVRTMANIFNVSIQAMKIRLEKLSFLI